ncbi:MAG: PEP-CTERM sorting domain-containing protein [Azoarcus sp.]|jgi:hypothetical protein|nr:PEP-CTERM sorting domain-containing protein [Azoarcus sp.]
MPKLLAAFLLSLGSVSALAAEPSTLGVLNDWLKSEDPTASVGAAQGVYGGTFYVVDLNAPVEFTYVGGYADHNIALSMYFVYASGEQSKQKGIYKWDDNAYSVDLAKISGESNPVVEIVFVLEDMTTWNTYKSNTLEYLDHGRGGYLNDTKYHAVAYYDIYDGQTLVGFEDMSNRERSDWDYNDFVVLVNNVSKTPVPFVPPTPAVPEPEAYAMLLAGLGLVGAVARRRRERV